MKNVPTRVEPMLEAVHLDLEFVVPVRISEVILILFAIAIYNITLQICEADLQTN